MLQNPIELSNDENEEWAIRSENWIASASELAPLRKRRERNVNSLIITGHGASLRVEHGALIIRDGFTHHPQKQIIHCYFPGSRDVPQRVLLLDGSGSLSFDALSWLGEQGVALARIKWTGDISIVGGTTGFSSDREKVGWQQEQRGDPAKQIAFAIDLVRQKLLASIETLANHIPASQKREVALKWHETALERLRSHDFQTVNALRGVEAQSASLYFAAWKGMPIIWKGRRPVPDVWQTFDIRSSMANGSKPVNRSASHPVNALLNYAYAIKLVHMQIDCIAQGYDPTIGIFHHARRGKPAYVLDIIEPERPKVDSRILTFVAQQKFSADDFILRKDGVCRLSPQLARMVATIIR